MILVAKIVQRGLVYTLHRSSNCNIITVHNQSQEVNTGTTHKTYSDFSNFTCTYLRVKVCVCVREKMHMNVQSFR